MSNLAVILADFFGTYNYYTNPLYPAMKYTDGVKAFAEHAANDNGAYWLLDILGTEVHPILDDENPFLSVTVIVANKKADIEVTDGNSGVLHTRAIDYTDLDEGEWKFFMTDNVLMLPSEY